jgi:hypothetical protein
LGSSPIGENAFGGEHDVVSPPFQRLADDLLGLALAVPVGGVDEVDAEVERLWTMRAHSP